MTSSFSKCPVFKMFYVHAKMESQRFQIPKASFSRRNIVGGGRSTVGLTVEIKLSFHISPA